MSELKTLSLTGARWIEREADTEVVNGLARGGCVPTVARILAARGVRDTTEVEALFNPTLDDLHDPYLMHGMDVAVARLRKAIASQEPVRVVTDYDVDGTTSSLILQATLRLRGLQGVSFSIPHRMKEGYGFSEAAVAEAKADGISLIITADIGVKDHAAVTAAREAGIDVIILDHHLPPDSDVPAGATAVLCPPQAACSYPNPSLAACGVSLKFAQALLSEHPKFDRIFASMLKLAAIGTVADVVDLFTPENRAIVTLGLRELNKGPHAPGLAALIEVADLQLGGIDEGDLGYRIGPRINAAGRMDSAHAIVDLFDARDRETARQLARAIDEQNSARREVQRRLVRMAEEKIGERPPNFIVVDGDEEREGWHRGVVGIVAARLRDRYYRPAAVIARTEDGGRASVRSTAEVHAVDALDACKDLLTRYGGHPAAAGFSVPLENIEALRARLDEVAVELAGGAMPSPARRYDVELHDSELSWELLAELRRVAPYGKGNPAPVLLVKEAHPYRLRRVKEQHVIGQLTPTCSLTWWGAGEAGDALFAGRAVDLIGSLEIHEYRGRRELQFNIRDARYSS